MSIRFELQRNRTFFGSMQKKISIRGAFASRVDRSKRCGGRGGGEGGGLKYYGIIF